MENVFESLAAITRPQPKDNIGSEYFIHQQNQINKAIYKVKAKLQEYSTQAAKITGPWDEDQQEQFKDWNNYHDLQHRLECRLKANFSDYQGWHFDKFGWCAF